MASTRVSRTHQDSSTALGGDSTNAAVQTATQGMPVSVTAVATQGTPVTQVASGCADDSRLFPQCGGAATRPNPRAGAGGGTGGVSCIPPSAGQAAAATVGGQASLVPG